MSYCTTNNFEISPGVWTHNYTSDEVSSMEKYGCCQFFVCQIACPKVRFAAVAVCKSVSSC